MGLFPSPDHSDAAEIMIATWAQAWIAEASTLCVLDFCFPGPRCSFCFFCCAIVGNRARIHQGE
eukprot:7463741-Pyramimonas_sp.AAC.1